MYGDLHGSYSRASVFGQPYFFPDIKSFVCVNFTALNWGKLRFIGATWEVLGVEDSSADSQQTQG